MGRIEHRSNYEPDVVTLVDGALISDTTQWTNHQQGAGIIYLFPDIHRLSIGIEMQAMSDGFSGMIGIELVDPLKGRVLHRAEASWDAGGCLRMFYIARRSAFSPQAPLLGLGRGECPSGNDTRCTLPLSMWGSLSRVLAIPILLIRLIYYFEDYYVETLKISNSHSKFTLLRSNGTERLIDTKTGQTLAWTTRRRSRQDRLTLV